MVKYIQLAATVEQATDGTWTAAVIGEHSTLGTGATRDAAIEDLRQGLVEVSEYLRSEGKTLTAPAIEVVSIEVAA